MIKVERLEGRSLVISRYQEVCHQWWTLPIYVSVLFPVDESPDEIITRKYNEWSQFPLWPWLTEVYDRWLISVFQIMLVWRGEAETQSDNRTLVSSLGERIEFSVSLSQHQSQQVEQAEGVHHDQCLPVQSGRLEREWQRGQVSPQTLDTETSQAASE